METGLWRPKVLVKVVRSKSLLLRRPAGLGSPGLLVITQHLLCIRYRLEMLLLPDCWIPQFSATTVSWALTLAEC
jgi:hypothetical protein